MNSLAATVAENIVFVLEFIGLVILMVAVAYLAAVYLAGDTSTVVIFPFIGQLDLGIFYYILAVLFGTWLIITFVGQRTQVSGSSMETTLSDGDQLIVDKISYRFRDPSRYDIVVFPYKYAGRYLSVRPGSSAPPRK